MTMEDFIEFITADPDGDYEILYRNWNTIIIRSYDMCIQYWSEVSAHVHTVPNVIDIYSYEDYLDETNIYHS